MKHRSAFASARQQAPCTCRCIKTLEQHASDSQFSTVSKHRAPVGALRHKPVRGGLRPRGSGTAPALQTHEASDQYPGPSRKTAPRIRSMRGGRHAARRPPTHRCLHRRTAAAQKARKTCNPYQTRLTNRRPANPPAAPPSMRTTTAVVEAMAPNTAPTGTAGETSTSARTSTRSGHPPRPAPTAPHRRRACSSSASAPSRP